MVERLTQTILSEINPENQPDGSIRSPKLYDAVINGDVPQNSRELWSRFEQSEQGSLEELAIANELAKISLLKTGLAQQNKNRDPELYARRYTQASLELYGNVEHVEALRVFSEQVQTLELGDDIISGLNVYASKEGFENNNESTVNASEVLSDDQKHESANALFSMNQDILELIDGLEDKAFSSAEVRTVVDGLLENRATMDNAWAEWSVANRKGKTNFMVSASKKEIDIPDGREDVSSKTELSALLVHELGHARRAVNGKKNGGQELATGLPQYIEFEEGLMVFAETFVSGKVPDKNEDRYVDIALALGVLGKPVSRSDLIDFASARDIARCRLKGADIDEEIIRNRATKHVNRIFRGGDGRQYGQDREVQAVFAKDHIYHSGMLKAKSYFKEKLDAGYSAEEIWSYLFSGKFDPLQSSHVNFLAKGGINLN